MVRRKRLIDTALILSLLCLVVPQAQPTKATKECSIAKTITPVASNTLAQMPTPIVLPTLSAMPEPPKLELGAGNTEDVRTDPNKYYYSADELASGLLHELVPLAPYFVQAQKDYGIDAVFLAAVAAEESGWGRYLFRKNNIFGFEKCNFDSLPECIDYAANWIKTQYLTPDGLYYNGESVAAINTRYNGRSTWEEHVTKIMTQIVNRIESEE